MDLKVLFVVFGTVFLAELGDKTQLATVLFASKPSVSLVTVFVGASLALILSSLIPYFRIASRIATVLP